MLNSKKSIGSSLVYSMKKCPYCYSMLKLDAHNCDSCKNKVGAVNKAGFADKRFDWKAYLSAALACTAFIVYIWWFFLK
jgi:hypothetical protein